MSTLGELMEVLNDVEVAGLSRRAAGVVLEVGRYNQARDFTLSALGIQVPPESAPAARQFYPPKSCARIISSRTIEYTPFNTYFFARSGG